MIMAMSGRFILALAGIALLIPFFFLPPGIVATVLLVAAGLTLLFSFAQVGRSSSTTRASSSAGPDTG